MQAVIMAGGKGTRLATITKDLIPKPMAQVCGKPILQWQIDELRQNGISDIIIAIGHLGEKIKDYFSDGSSFGVHIEYVQEREPLGSAGSFYYIKEKIVGEHFLLVFGDIFFSMDIARLVSFHKSRGGIATLTVHPNSHPFDSDLIVADEHDKVIGIDSKENKRDYYYDNCVNAGLYMCSRHILDAVDRPEKIDLEKKILSDIIRYGYVLSQNGLKIEGTVYAYHTPEYIKDLGTVERILSAESEIASGLPEKRNLASRQRAIFLDRDGVINEVAHYVTTPDKLVIIDGVVEAIKKINASGMLAILITNQPVIAQGRCTLQTLQEIFKKLKTVLGDAGAYLDDIYFCPHHPDRGFEGELVEYKIDCECRKPKPGMILAAAKKYNIDLNSSYMIGDMTADIACAKNSGVTSVLVQTGYAGLDGKHEGVPDMVCRDLLDAVEEILELRV